MLSESISIMSDDLYAIARLISIVVYRYLVYAYNHIYIGPYIGSHFNTYPATILYWGEEGEAGGCYKTIKTLYLN